MIVRFFSQYASLHCLHVSYILLHGKFSKAKSVVDVSLITAEEFASVLLPSQEVLSECGKNDWTMAVAGT